MAPDFLELLAVAGAAFGIGLSGAMMPGPVLTVTLANVERKGSMAGPWVTFGHGIVEGALVIALALGAGSFLARNEVSGAIAVVGAAVLAWMGWGMITEARRGNVGFGAETSDTRIPGPIVGGVLASLSNPYWYLWWATVGFSSVAVVQQWGGIGIATFFAGHILADLAWLTLVAWALSRGRKLMSDRLYHGLIGVLGAFLLVFSGLFFVFGVTRFT